MKRLLAASFLLSSLLSPAFADTSPPKKLPAPNPSGKVEQRPDGTCWQDEPHCPPNAKCEPPTPRQVQCPPKKPS